MDSLILRSKTVRRKISDKNQLAEQVKQLSPLLLLIINLIIHIPQLKNQTNYFYFRLCQYVNDIQEDLFNAGIASNVSTILTQFTKVCKVFTKL